MLLFTACFAWFPKPRVLHSCFPHPSFALSVAAREDAYTDATSLGKGKAGKGKASSSYRSGASRSQCCAMTESTLPKFGTAKRVKFGRI